MGGTWFLSFDRNSRQRPLAGAAGLRVWPPREKDEKGLVNLGTHPDNGRGKAAAHGSDQIRSCWPAFRTKIPRVRSKSKANCRKSAHHAVAKVNLKLEAKSNKP
jgi:hypothetical protein